MGVKTNKGEILNFPEIPLQTWATGLKCNGFKLKQKVTERFKINAFKGNNISVTW